MTPVEVATILARQGELPSSIDPDQPLALEHRVALGSDRSIRVIETFTPRAFFRTPRRALLMLPGPMVNAAFCNIRVPGFHAGEIVANAGLFSFVAEFEGTGGSSYPANGRSPLLSLQVEAMGRVLAYIRSLREVPRVDLLGESWGGGVAVELGRDEAQVRSCTLASMAYRAPAAALDAAFRSPSWRAQLDSLPDGYLRTAPAMYENLVRSSPEAVRSWAYSTQPGRYCTVPLYDVFELPFYDPGLARVPGLIIQGEHDPLNTVADVQDLARSYGTNGARLRLVSGAGHVPRLEDAHRDAVWSALLEFLDP
jgi:pimeloyl-ACP methyl ester carboxylesterase